jgi:hypothetical protein
MSNVGDALSGGGSSASGVTDSTFSDATLGDQMQGGTGDFTGSDISASDAGGGGFQNFSNLATALSGGGAGVGASPAAAQAASMAPTPGAASASGGDPVGAASGTQSGTDPGSTQTGQNQQQQTKPNQNDQQYAPKSATDQLKALLKQLSGKPAGPTGPTVQAAQSAPFAPAGQTMPLPALARGQTGSQSPQMPLPALAAGQTGDQSTGSFQGTSVQPGDGSPVSQVAGAPAANASIPPGAATQPSAAVSPPAAPTQGGGRDITVQKAAPQGMPWPQNEPGEVAPGGPALPTRKPTQPPEAEQPATAASPAAAPPTGAGATPRILQDISGASTGSPTALADLAQAARIILPLVGMFMGGGRGRRGGGFHGGRFTHGVGGFRGGGFHPGGRFGHPAWRGAWPYHHPVHGWDMHHQHPGGGWLPLNPAEMGNMGGGQQGGQPGAQDPNAPDPDKPPKETGAEVGPPDQVGASGAIPNVSAKMVDDYTRQAASKWGIDPDTASRVLAQESRYGQAKKPGDNGTSFGPFQLHFAQDGKAMGDQFQHDTGLNPRDPSTWKAQIDYAMKQAAQGGWKPWTTTMNKLGMGQWSGITTRDKFAGQPRTNIEPAWAAAAPTPTLPLTSQPMVAGP